MGNKVKKEPTEYEKQQALLQAQFEDALLITIRNNFHERTAELLQANEVFNYNINFYKEWQNQLITPLHLAVISNRIKVTTLLLEYDADETLITIENPNPKNIQDYCNLKLGQTALQIAIHYYHIEIIKILSNPEIMENLKGKGKRIRAEKNRQQFQQIYSIRLLDYHKAQSIDLTYLIAFKREQNINVKLMQNLPIITL